MFEMVIITTYNNVICVVKYYDVMTYYRARGEGLSFLSILSFDKHIFKNNMGQETQIVYGGYWIHLYKENLTLL